MNFKSTKLEPVMGAIKKSVDLVNERNPAEAAEACAWAIREARKLGVESPGLYWHAAVANDYAENWEAAFEYITRALELDPLTEPYRKSFEIITTRIRDALAKSDRAPDDPSTPKLYALLVRSGEADVESHAAMARYALWTGDVNKAKAIADAMTLLFPTSAAAWSCKSAVATAVGDKDAVDACTIELATIGTEPVPFGIPGPGEA